MSKPLIVIVGPTASGKSDLAMKVALAYDGEIICADSRTVYKGMDIGTAKPSPEDQALIKHHLLDIVAPDEPFTAADFKRLADQAVADIRARGKLPILVGGTGLYIDAVIFNYRFGMASDPERRTTLQALSVEELQTTCRDNNIEIPVNNQNRRHLIRAIELSGLINNDKILIPYTLVVSITTERDELRKRVIARAEAMFNGGIVHEVKSVAAKYGWDHESMTGNIYRVVRGVVEGTKTQDQATEEFIRSDMSLAKRQVTWFKRNHSIHWGEPTVLFELIDDFLHVVKR